MKKLAALLLCLVFAGGVGAYLYLTWPPSAGGQAARYLPPDALAAVRLTHLNTLSDRFPGSPLGRFMARETVHAMLTELRADRETVARYDDFHDGIAQVMTNPAFRAVFGEDATLAVLPLDQAAFARDPADTLRRSSVIIAATQASGALDLVGRLSSGANITRETVDGLELTKVVLDDGQTVFAHVDGGTVLFAYAPALISRCMQVRGSDQNLQEAATFQQAAAFWAPYAAETTFARAYVNTAALGPLLQQSEYPDLQEAGALLQGVDYGVSVSRLTDRGVEVLARSQHGYDRLHEVVRGAVDAASGPNHSLHLLQEQSLAYNWSASLRPETLSQLLAADGQNDAQSTALARDTFGVSLEELGRAVGPQYGLVLNGITAGGLFPIPRLTLFLGVQDRAVAETALTSLRRKVAGYGLAVEEQEQFQGRAIYSWPLLPGESAQPAAVLTDTMLYLANGKQTLKDLLAATATQAALAPAVAEQLGPELSERVQAANFGSFVLYPERLSHQTGPLVDWLASILATTKNLSVSRVGSELQQLMRATECVVATTGLDREGGKWALTVRLTVPGSAEKTAP